MNKRLSTLYSPALRMKAGELRGLRDLASDISECVVPRLIVPPPYERKGVLEPRFMIGGDRFPDVSKALSESWPNRFALIESTYLMGEFGRDRLSEWLPRMFDVARQANTRPIPLVTARDLRRDGSRVAYGSSIDFSHALRFGVVFSSGELADQEAINATTPVLEKLGLQPEDCFVIADFHDAEFSNPDMVAPIISAVLETLQTSGHWQRVIFQGTSYPERNPASPSGCIIIPRNEWLAWKNAVSFDPDTADHLAFGDYAADCAKIDFRPSQASTIRHYRYAISDAWLVQRGPNDGNHRAAMREVCKEIEKSGHFAGRTFSSADEYIYQTARDKDGPGSATIWRGVNTTHHITRIVTDIGSIRGYSFSPHAVDEKHQFEFALGEVGP